MLEILAFDLARGASELSAQLHPVVRLSVAKLVRAMNWHYSNLIGGHNTHARDIDRAMTGDYSSDRYRRDLKLEARAYIEVQQRNDERVSELSRPPASRAFIEWTQRELCAQLRESQLIVEHPDMRERIPVFPGQPRARTVAVVRHAGPAAEDLPSFVHRCEEAYEAARLTKSCQVIAVAAAHHRFLWIHPFVDGNGRVARLMSHAMLMEIGLSRRSDRLLQILSRDRPRPDSLHARAALSFRAAASNGALRA